MENWISILKQKILKQEIITQSQIISILPFNMLETWDNFMRGKTCPILDNGDRGVYVWDLKQFLNLILRNVKDTENDF